MIPAPIKPEVSIEVLEKLDIRVGTILAIDEVADSKKLVKLTVDLGYPDGVTPALAVPERPIPNGARAG